VKVGIVVPYSWSYWGGVVEHAEEQAAALEELGVETRLIMGYDPPGPLSRFLHPRAGRLDPPPPHLLRVGRSVITPANSSLANIVLSPSAIPRTARLLERERFDIVHVHEPLTPVIGVAALIYANTPVVATFHAAGRSRWRGLAAASWGFLLDRITARLAVSEPARLASNAYAPGEYRIVPNGVRLPNEISTGGREHNAVFVGRHEARKGLSTLLKAWPTIHAQTGARLRVIGADPLAVRLLITRQHIDDTAVDLLGVIPTEQLDEELARAKLLVAPSLGGESFGMVITRAFASATPVVASDIDGYRDVASGETGLLVPPGETGPLAEAVVALLADETRRQRAALEARRRAELEYDWRHVARRLVGIYEEAVTSERDDVAVRKSRVAA
jgi:phosphatidylinositol alpha-mannosyltransferase